MSANRDFSYTINEFAEIIKSTIDIVTHITKYENLTQQGTSWIGPHSEHDSKGNACFSINSEEQYYHCFHCNEGGDIITFEATRLQCTNLEAMKNLANEYNISIPNFSKYEKMTDEEKEEFNRQTQEYEVIKQILIDYSEIVVSKLNHIKDYVAKRGITEEFAKETKLGYGHENVKQEMLAKGYTIVQLSEAGLFTESGTQILLNRLIIPTLDKQGNPCHFIGRDLSNNPKASKYLSQRSNQNQNYQAVQRSLWQYGNLKDKLNDNRTPKPILLVEGSIDAILAAQTYKNKYVIISANTTKLSNQQIEQLCKSLIDVGYRKIYICNDNDTNNAGHIGAITTIQKINSKLTELIINQNADEETRKLQEEELKGILPDCYITILRRSPHKDKIDLADLITAKRDEEALYWINSSITMDQYNAKLIDNPIRFYRKGSKGGKGEFIQKRVVDEILTDGCFFLWYNEQLYWYEPKGVYIPCQNHIEVLIKNKLGDNATADLIKKVYDLLEITSKDDRISVPYKDHANQELMVNTKSGWLDFSKPPLSHDPIPHSPYKVSFFQINITYNKEADCPLYGKFLNEVLAQSDHEEWLKMVGYMLVRTLKYQKAFMLTGLGGNGKSTAIEVLQKLLGKDNYSLRSLKDLETDSYAKADLVGKLANFHTDLPPGYIPSEGVFKPLVDGASTSARRIYGKPFEFNPECLLIFSANEIPRTNDSSYAYYRRWIFFAFDRRFSETEDEDTNLIYKLTTSTELSGIFNLAWMGYRMLEKDGGFKTTERSEDIMEEYKSQNDIINAFVMESLRHTENENDYVSKTDLYNLFKDYVNAKGTGREKVSAIRFNKRIKQIIPTITEKDDKSNNNKRSWQGVQIKDEIYDEITTNINNEDSLGL